LCIDGQNGQHFGFDFSGGGESQLSAHDAHYAILCGGLGRSDRLCRPSRHPKIGIFASTPAKKNDHKPELAAIFHSNSCKSRWMHSGKRFPTIAENQNRW
jgi:hypothetical protein